MTLSDGTMIEKRVMARRLEAKLQRRLPRACNGSASRAKKSWQLARERRRVVERQNGVGHELASNLLADYDGFAVEDLPIKNLTTEGGNHKRGLNRSINEQRWGILTQMMEYKAEKAGIPFARVYPKHTSQTCSSCEQKAAIKLGWLTGCPHAGIAV